MLEEYHSVETIFRKQSFHEYYLTLHEFAEALDANQLYNTDRRAPSLPARSSVGTSFP